MRPNRKMCILTYQIVMVDCHDYARIGLNKATIGELIIRCQQERDSRWLCWPLTFLLAIVLFLLSANLD